VTFLLPINALWLGAAFLGERVTLQATLGMALIGAGLAAIDGRLLFLEKAKSSLTPSPWPGSTRPSMLQRFQFSSRSSQSGLCFWMRSIFQARFQRFKLVSRLIASV